MLIAVMASAVMMLLLGGCRGSKTERISARMAFEGVSNYCHSEFDCTKGDSPLLYG